MSKHVQPTVAGSPHAGRRRRFSPAITALLAVSLGATAAPVPASAKPPAPTVRRARPDLLGLALPPRTRVGRDGALTSGQAFRPTVQFYKRLLQRRGQQYREIPTYSRRGTTVARLLSASPSARWAAIHIWKTGSRTRIAIIAKTDLTPVPQKGTQPVPGS